MTLTMQKWNGISLSQKVNAKITIVEYYLKLPNIFWVITTTTFILGDLEESLECFVSFKHPQQGGST